MRYVLGSSSKPRQQLFTEMGYEFEAISPNIDEKAIRDENPEKLVLAIARAKADALKERISEPAILITSDQVVVWNRQIREKPENEEEAKEFLKSYSEHPAETVTGIVVTNTATNKQVEGIDNAKMYFKPLPDEVIYELIKEGEVMWCSGGFMGEHQLLQSYIDHLEGSIDSIMGFPKGLVNKLIDKVK